MAAQPGSSPAPPAAAKRRIGNLGSWDPCSQPRLRLLQQEKHFSQLGHFPCSRESAIARPIPPTPPQQRRRTSLPPPHPTARSPPRNKQQQRRRLQLQALPQLSGSNASVQPARRRLSSLDFGMLRGGNSRERLKQEKDRERGGGASPILLCVLARG
ncbi:Hypothetical predicted protein [Podarcis lilfordi]|uniref:Uncharacterized protein n=1 Tax=Podarcis lilfordi TaxID=74358 RepID=A0AA35JMN4_9SAUR|nr:Hypothetical predicted protein [Podarcis lilfordi]